MSIKRLWVDTETTGLDPTKHGVIQIALMIEIDGSIVEKHKFNVRPPKGTRVEKAALEVSGITMDQIRSFPLHTEVYPLVTDVLNKHVNKYDKADKFILCGQNVSFDAKFMKAFFEASGDKYWGSYVHYGKNFDTLYTSKALIQSKKMEDIPKRNLGALCSHFGIPLTNAHDAMADIEATYLVGKELEKLMLL